MYFPQVFVVYTHTHTFRLSFRLRATLAKNTEGIVLRSCEAPLSPVVGIAFNLFLLIYYHIGEPEIRGQLEIILRFNLWRF